MKKKTKLFNNKRLLFSSYSTTVNYAVKKSVFENLIQGERENLEEEQDILISKVEYYSNDIIEIMVALIIELTH